MTKRVNTKIGDIFSANIDDSTKRYFQLVAFDLTQLNSDVIRIFKGEYPIDANPAIEDIINSDVDLFVHSVTKLGIKMNLWQKTGSSKDVGDISNIMFRDTNDYGYKEGDKRIQISNNWYIWRINDDKFTTVGKLIGENRNAYIGLVINPIGIIEMLKGNKYPINYPDFE